MKKNILFVMTSLGNGGAERSLINLLQLIDYNKYNVDLLLFKRKGIRLNEVPKKVNIINQSLNLKGVYGENTNNIFKNFYFFVFRTYSTLISKFHSSSITESKQYRWKYFYSKKIEKIDKKYDTAIAYIQGEPIYYIADKVDSDNKICWMHNDYSRIATNDKTINFDKEYFKQFNHIVTISNICADILKERIKDTLCVNRVKVLYNITSSDIILKKANEFYPIEYKFSSGLKILSIGRLTSQKRFDRVIETSKILKENNYNFKWYILGEGNEYKSLKKMIKRNQIDENVFLLGTRDNPYPYIKEADLIVQTSEYEGKSMALDEAKILNKIIVSTDYDSVYDQIENDKTGVIVKQTADSLYKGIINVIKDKKLKNKIENELKKEKWSNEEEIQKYYDIF